MEGTKFTLALYPPRIKGNTQFGLTLLSSFFPFYLPLLHLLLVGCCFIARYCFVAYLLAHFSHLLLSIARSFLLLAHLVLSLAAICSLAFTTCYCFDVCYCYLATWFCHLLLFCCLLSPLVTPIVIDPFKNILIFWLWNIIYQSSL